MNLTGDYHIHSKYSKNGHCKNEFEEIVKTAIKKGLREIAISDHGIKHIFYGTSEKNLLKARKEIDLLNEKYENINIKLGIEANLISFEGETDISSLVLENCDVIQMGIHYGVVFKGLKGAFEFLILNFLGRYIPSIRKKMITKNTLAMIKAMERYNIDIITHPGDKIPVDIDSIAKAAAKFGVKLEINNSHRHLSSDEIAVAAKYDVSFIIGSDSHDYENIGEFNSSLERILISGIDESRVVNLEV